MYEFMKQYLSLTFILHELAVINVSSHTFAFYEYLY